MQPPLFFLKSKMYLLPVILPLATLHIHLALGAVGFPPSAHMWFAIAEFVVMLPAALVAGRFYYRHVLLILGISMLANESASHLSASFASAGIAGPAIALWVMFSILVGLKTLALCQAYSVLQTISSKSEI